MKHWRRALQAVVLIVIFYFLFRDLRRNWQEVVQYDWRFDIPRLILSLLALCVVLGAMVPIWRAILRRMGHDLPVGEVDEPLDLDVDPLPVEGWLGQVVDEGCPRAAIATVEGAERDGGCDVSKRAHGRILPSTNASPSRGLGTVSIGSRSP